MALLTILFTRHWWLSMIVYRFARRIISLLPVYIRRKFFFNMNYCTSNSKALQIKIFKFWFFNSNCACGNTFHYTSVAPSTCNLPCPGNATQHCGGSSFMYASVYSEIGKSNGYLLSFLIWHSLKRGIMYKENRKSSKKL